MRLDCSKLAKNRQKDNSVTIFRNDVIVKFFDAVSLVKFSYWSKSHVNIITVSGYGTNVSNEMLLNAAKCQLQLLPSVLLRENQQGSNNSGGR